MQRTPRPLLTVLAVLAALAPVVTSGCAEAPRDATRVRDDAPRAQEGEASARLRAFHLAAQAPALALTYDDGRPMVDGIVFGGSTDDVAMPAGEHAFTVALAGEGTVMATTGGLRVDEDAAATLVVWGDLAEMRATLLPAAREEGYRVMNAVPGGAAIGVALGGDAPSAVDAGALTATRVSDGVLAVDADGDGAADATYTLPALEEGEGGSVDIFCVGAADAASAGGITVVASTSDGLVIVPADGAVPPARVRAIHLSANAPAVDVFVDGARAIEGLTFQSASPYAALPADRYDVAVSPAGAGVDAAVLSVDALELFAARAFSAVAFGDLPNIQALALEDDYAPVSAGNIRIRAAHTADGVGRVDVLVVPAGPGEALDATNNTVVIDDLDFGAATPSFEIPAAAITLGLDLDEDRVPEVVFAVPALPTGTVATLFATADAQGVALFVALEDGSALLRGAAPAPPAPPALVRVVHLAPEAPAVAVNANGARIVETLSFLGATAFAEVASGTTDLDVALATAPDAPILSLAGAALAPESFTTAVAFGRVDDLRVLALAEDRSAPAAGSIRIRAVHTAIGIGDVDIYAGGALLVDDLAFGAAADALEVPAGQYTLGLDLDEDTHPDLHFALPHLAAGTIANVFAVTDAHGTATLALQE